jgi:hypothetical protein
MKRLLALVAAAGVAVALYAATATGSQQAVTPAQLNALKKQVAVLKKDVKDLQGAIACLGPTGVASFGSDTAGFHYKQPDGSEILTSALDFTAQGQQPQALLATIDPQCVSARFRLLHIHGSGSLRR